MQAKRLIVDVSSLCWTGLLAGKDEEFSRQVEHNDKLVTVNGWRHGWENVINSLVSAWDKTGIQPKDTILVYETGNSKGLRKRFLPTYKDGRDDGRPQDAYTEFNTLKEKLLDAVRSLGGATVTRPNLEADDVIAYLAEKLQGYRVIMSGDADLGACITDEVHMWRKGELVTENPIGPWPVSWIPVYKALVGDPSDKIPGAKGFGEKAWLDLIAIFGADGIELMEGLIVHKQLDRLTEDVADFKALQRIIDNKDMVYASYAAGKLYPEQCENMRVPLQWSPGYVKPRKEIEDERLRKYAGVTRLVHAGNYEEAFAFTLEKLKESEWVALDLETTTPEESDDWLASNNSKGVDVVGSEIVSMGLTFGSNQQFNLYFTLNHKEEEGVENISRDQFRAVLECFPDSLLKVVQNYGGFEAPVIRLNFGDINGKMFHTNVVDTRIAANYVNENISTGLKQSTQHYFGVEQLDYDTVTQGRKMHEMTARETLAYGSGDTIFTSALWNHYRRIMEIEGSYNEFRQVEEKPAYVTALAFCNGTPISLETMRVLEEADNKKEEELQQTLFAYLINKGWEGTVCPVFTAEDLTTPAKIKEIYKLVIGEDLKTMVRTPDKLYKLIAAENEADHLLLAKYMSEGNLDQINDWVSSRFDGKPQLDMASPKQLRKLLYEVMKLPVNIINKVTDTEKTKNRELAEACWKFNKIKRGSQSTDPMTDGEMALVRTKASTDSTAIAFALEFDLDPSSDEAKVLEAFQELKEIATRRSLFYSKYWAIPHWKTQRVHASLRQCSTVTRRHTSSFPNMQQLPKSPGRPGFRDIFVSQYPNGVIISADLAGCELRLGADLSRDPALLACFTGDNQKDMHALTASAAMEMKWGKEALENLSARFGLPFGTADEKYALFLAVLHGDDPEWERKAKELRAVGKSTNFASAFGSQAAKLGELLVIPLEDAEVMLDAKFSTFSRYEDWKKEVEAEVERTGYVTTYGGGRRHLADAVNSDDKWEREKALRQASNFMIQSSAGVALRTAMGSLWDSGILQNLRCNFVACVHDELVIDAHPEDALEVAKVLHSCMTPKMMQAVDFVSSLSLGRSFGQQIEVEFPNPAVFCEDATRRVLEQVLEVAHG